MPPREAVRLSADEIALVREWINHGANPASVTNNSADDFAGGKRIGHSSGL